jgi:outer membrane protein assembly factor BamD (BamD/ComL family)
VSVAAELALIREAERALAAGRYDAALVALRRHEDRFPDGQLTQEREASRITALCRSGAVRAVDGEELVSRFLARWPSSHLKGRVRRACVGE